MERNIVVYLQLLLLEENLIDEPEISYPVKLLWLHEDIYHLQYNHQVPSFRMISSSTIGVAFQKQE